MLENVTIIAKSIITGDLKMQYTQDSVFVKVWGEKVLADSNTKVPKLFNLQEEVAKYVEARKTIVEE